jgi:hypothetical protein
MPPGVGREGLLDTYTNHKLIDEIKQRIEQQEWSKEDWIKLVAVDYDSSLENGRKEMAARKLKRDSLKKHCGLETHTPWFPDMSEVETKDGLLARIFITLEHPSKSWVGFQISNIMIFFIFASTAALLLESMEFTSESPMECDELIKKGEPLTVEACEPLPHTLFNLIEIVCILCFTAEYVPKILFVHAVNYKDAGLEVKPANGLIQTLYYATGPFLLIDFGAIFPFYLELTFGVEGSKMAVLRVLRLFRIFRIFKVGKFNRSLMLVYNTVVNSLPALTLMLWVEMIAMLLLGSLVHTFESSQYDTSPDWSSNYHCGIESGVFGIFGQETCRTVAGEPLVPGQYIRPTYDGYEMEPSPFTSISISFWWCLTTMTTVGYGDFYPTTAAGKLVGVMCMWFGVVFVAMPISVLGMHFEANYDDMMAVEEDKEDEARRAGVNARRDKATERQTIPFSQRPLLPGGDNWRQCVFKLFEFPSFSHVGKFVSIGVLLVIGGSVLNFVMAAEPAYQEIPESCMKLIAEGKPLETEACQPEPLPIFGTIELYCIVIFTVDYLCRVLTVHSMPAEDAGIFMPQIEGEKEGTFAHLTALGKTWEYIKIPFNLIDLAAIAPFYVTMLTGTTSGGFSVLRALRLLRVFRVLRMPKFNSGLEMILKVISKSIPALTVLVFLGVLAMILFGSLIYFIEGNSEYSVDERWLNDFPHGVYIRPTISGDYEPTPFRSIPGAFWWVSVTVTTVGYGDFYPTSTAGRVVGVLLFYFGVIMLALPITILGNNFVIEYGLWEKKHEEEVEQKVTKAKKVMKQAGRILDRTLSRQVSRSNLSKMAPTPSPASPTPRVPGGNYEMKRIPDSTDRSASFDTEGSLL